MKTRLVLKRVPGIASAFMLSAMLVFPVTTRTAEPDLSDWTNASPRDEIRPAFSFKKDGGPNHHGSLIIRADGREGLDGHWMKTFPIKGGQYYRF